MDGLLFLHALASLIGIVIGVFIHWGRKPVRPVFMKSITRIWVVNNHLRVELEWFRVASRRIDSKLQQDVIEIVDSLVVSEAHESVEVGKCWDPRARDYFTGEQLFLKPAVKNTVMVGFGPTITVWFEPQQYLLETLRWLHGSNH